MIQKKTLTFSNPLLEQLTDKEWIITNGIGGYASSSICGLNTRKYHGLLVASFNPPTDRKVLVSKIEDCVIYNNKIVELSSNQYPDVIHPKGFKNLKEFSREDFPTFLYKHESVLIKKKLCMVYGVNATIVSYTNESSHPVELVLNPLFVERDFHWVSKKNDSYNFYFKEEKDYLKLYPKNNSHPIFIKHSTGKFNKNRCWFYNFQYLEEKNRGMDFTEDLFSIGTYNIPLESNQTTYLIFSLEEDVLKDNPEIYFIQEEKRLKELVPYYIQHEWTKDLIKSGNQFIVKRASTQSYSIIAGYHWFSDWGRDTMIAIRGLCIVQGRKDEAKSIIETFLNYLSEGMLPNRFPDSGEEPEYNTVDATLWLFIALYEYYKTFEDINFIKKIIPQLEDIIKWHEKGTRYDIKLTQEGLIHAGNENTQLTWMDARCDGKAITPRNGCAVEINVLWYNALRILKYFYQELHLKRNSVDELIQKFEKSFKTYFFNEDGYLNDVVIPERTIDNSIRPNQILALSLPFRLLSSKEEISILNKVQEELFTPYGLRTLSPTHPEFKKIYFGDALCRDSAYHQGTIWPFLLGEFYTAYLRINNYSKGACNFVKENLKTLETHFYTDSCIYGISEIFDGAKPINGKGAIQQAWSISAILKVILENKVYKNIM